MISLIASGGEVDICHINACVPRQTKAHFIHSNEQLTIKYTMHTARTDSSLCDSAILRLLNLIGSVDRVAIALFEQIFSTVNKQQVPIV